MKDTFKELKVIELSSILAGPLVGSFFAELGAEVIKIENKRQGGDATRQWRLPDEDTQPVSAYYASANYGKQSEMLDLSDEADRSKVYAYVKDSDIVITNFQKKTAEKLKVNIELLRVINDNAIIAQLNAYDYDDPRPGYDMVMQAETGFLSMTGTPEGENVKMPVALIDVLAAHQMKEAILIALLKRERAKTGSIIHVSLYQSGISALANQASNYLMCDHVPKPLGTAHPNIAPYGDIITSKEGHKVILAIGSDQQFEKMIKSFNFNGDLLGQYGENRQRVKERENLMNHLRTYFRNLGLAYITHRLATANVPYSIIDNLESVFTNKLAKSMILNHEIDNTACKSVSSISFKFQK